MAIAAPQATVKEAAMTSKLDSIPRKSKVVTWMKAKKRETRERTSPRAAPVEEDGWVESACPS